MTKEKARLRADMEFLQRQLDLVAQQADRVRTAAQEGQPDGTEHVSCFHVQAAKFMPETHRTNTDALLHTWVYEAVEQHISNVNWQQTCCRPTFIVSWSAGVKIQNHVKHQGCCRHGSFSISLFHCTGGWWCQKRPSSQWRQCWANLARSRGST